MIARLRARARVRRLAPPGRDRLDRALERTRYGRALRGRLRNADARRSPAAFVRLSVASGLAGAMLGLVWAGEPAGVAGFLGGLAAPEVALRRRIARRSARVVEQLPEVLASLAAPVRAGASLSQAFAAAAAEAEPPLHDALDRTCRDLDAGVAIDLAVDRFAGRCAVREARLAARAIQVGRHAGGELARVLDETAETLRDRERLAHEVRAGTAQARVSAVVVASLPVVFLLIMSAGAGEQARLLFGEPVGWALLGIGGALEGAGLLWIRRLTAGPLRLTSGSRR